MKPAPSRAVYMRRRAIALAGVVIVFLAFILAVNGLVKSCSEHSLGNDAKNADTVSSSNVANVREPGSAIDVSLKKPDLTLLCESSRQMVVGTYKMGIVSSCGSEESHSIASVTKTITALVLLNSMQNPDKELDQVITINAIDMHFLAVSNENGGTSIQVFEGEQLTKRQALEGMILASSNNLANTLVVNQFGSSEAYQQKASEYLNQHKLYNAVVSNDASGLDDQTKVAPRELFEIGRLVLEQPVLKQVVNMQSMQFPTVASSGELTETITNGNTLLAVGFDGIKIGYTEEAGRCILFSRYDEDIDDEIVGLTLGDTNAASGFSFIDAQNISYDLQTALTGK